MIKFEDLTSVTTKRAAEIVGISYEGLRTYMKRGLIETDRGRWHHFSFEDLFRLVIARKMFLANMSFERVKELVETLNPIYCAPDWYLVVPFKDRDYGAAVVMWPHIANFTEGADYSIVISFRTVRNHILDFAQPGAPDEP